MKWLHAPVAGFALATVLLSATSHAQLHVEQHAQPAVTVAVATDKPVNALSSDGVLRHWLIVGPFPNEEVADRLPDGSFREGYGMDYLTALGGEAQAVMAADTVVQFVDEVGQNQQADTRRADASDEGRVNFDAIYGAADYKVAYAFCYIESDREQPAYFHFGSDDSAKIWLNGEQVHSLWTMQRGADAWDDNFAVTLHQGLNPLLVKVEDRGYGWEFVLEVYDEAGNQQKLIAKWRADFGSEKLQPEGGFLFHPGPFPPVEWVQAVRVERICGKFPLSVRWFDGQLNEVTQADQPGPYIAYIDAMTPDGMHIRRSLTAYCLPAGWRQRDLQPDITVGYPEGDGIDPGLWNENANAIGVFVSQWLTSQMAEDPQGAILLAGVHEMRRRWRQASFFESPEMMDLDRHVRLKRKLLGIDATALPVRLPRRLEDESAPILRDGTAEQAGVNGDAIAAIHDACQAWYDDAKVPFDALVARRGVVYFHEGFGQKNGKPVDSETTFPPASSIKSVTGLLFAHVLDQGLIDLDEPVGRYLPDFADRPAITFRAGLIHATGLSDQYGFGATRANRWVENQIANTPPEVAPGVRQRYASVGYALAATAMEVATGKSYWRLMWDHILSPLGMTHTRITSPDAGEQSTAEDMAKAGMLLLNRGRYGDREFFRPQSVAKVMPQPLKPFFPKLEGEYGCGIVWAREVVATGEKVLSENTVGHAAASGTIFRVDLDNELVVVLLRDKPGREYFTHCLAFLKAVEASLIDFHQPPKPAPGP